MNDIKLTLDLNKKPSGQHVYISASDNASPTIRVYITDNGQALTQSDLSGYGKRMKIRKPNGGVYSQSWKSGYADGSYSFELKPEANGVGAGETFGYVVLSKNDQILSTARFSITVLADAEVNQ